MMSCGTDRLDGQMDEGFGTFFQWDSNNTSTHSWGFSLYYYINIMDSSQLFLVKETTTNQQRL